MVSAIGKRRVRFRYTGQRSEPEFSEQASGLTLASAEFGQLFDAKPTPVDTMVPDQAV